MKAARPQAIHQPLGPQGHARAALRSRVAGAAGLAALGFALAMAGCATPVTRTAWVDSAPRSAVVLADRGAVEHIEVLQTQLQPTGGGAVIGGLLGGVVGNRFGEGVGRAATTAIGAVGGAVLGNEIERNEAAAAGTLTTYRVTVRLDNGGRRSIDFRNLNGLHVGERVHFAEGSLVEG